jgi:hypothetical protein
MHAKSGKYLAMFAWFLASVTACVRYTLVWDCWTPEDGIDRSSGNVDKKLPFYVT